MPTGTDDVRSSGEDRKSWADLQNDANDPSRKMVLVQQQPDML